MGDVANGWTNTHKTGDEIFTSNTSASGCVSTLVDAGKNMIIKGMCAPLFMEICLVMASCATPSDATERNQGGMMVKCSYGISVSSKHCNVKIYTNIYRLRT